MGTAKSHLAVAVTKELVTHLIRILAGQSFALCSHSIFYLILNDRTAFSVVGNHSLAVNGTLTLAAVYYTLQSCYLQYTYLRFASS